ncbi:MAG: TAXI family TRAP transporter solute-binding subunit [Acidobacteria bacterium]|nr:TAXI family TRAP transporter solute-binding subunit [Acidobacteriota bacterium]
MRFIRLAILSASLVLVTCVAGDVSSAHAQSPGAAKTGFAVKKPVFGGACVSCPWGAMAIVVKKALAPYGWDVQICWSCAGGARAARLMAAGVMAPPPANPTPDSPPTPPGVIDFGATGAQFLWWAYQGTHDFAKDPEGPRKNLRIIANIQDPQYMLVAVKADSGITDLRQIPEKKLPVRIMASTVGGLVTPAILDYYGLTKEAVAANGGQLMTSAPVAERSKLDVIIGFGTIDNAPEYNIWYDVSQRLDLKYLELPKDLREKLEKEFDLEEQGIPEGLLRGVDRRIPAVARTGTVIYGRTDMPDDFAYTVAKAMDEHQELLQWSNMAFSYNWHTVWKAYGVPLHPGAARYYKERGYMK